MQISLEQSHMSRTLFSFYFFRFFVVLVKLTEYSKLYKSIAQFISLTLQTLHRTRHTIADPILHDSDSNLEWTQL